jgi:outer membrane lipoprotein LolB
MPTLRFLSSILLAAALTGCATGTANLSNPAATVGAYRDTIDFSGKLAVNYQREGQPGSVSGNYTWTQRPDRIDVALTSPLGQTVAEITVTPQSATLVQRADRPPLVAKDIDTLTEQALGYALPVNGLRDWLQGYVTDAQGRRVAVSPANGNLVTRDGWRLRFLEWQDGAAAPSPRLITAERTATGGELQIRISVNPAG